MTWWLCTLLWAQAPAPAEAPSEPAAEVSGPTEVMLLWPDVKASIRVGTQTSGLPTTMELPVGEHQAHITATDGRVQIKQFVVKPSTGHPQVVDLATMPAVAVPGGRFAFSRPGAEGHALSIDGIDAGVLPATLVLSAGPHVVVVTAPDGAEQRFELTLKGAEGEVTEVVLR
jgi:hypothetical protein